jgi:hypothetical protein
LMFFQKLDLIFFSALLSSDRGPNLVIIFIKREEEGGPATFRSYVSPNKLT